MHRETLRHLYTHMCPTPTEPHQPHCVHTAAHGLHTHTHAQVASYDAHTLQENMQRFACLSCDSQMVGFSHWATI